MEEKVTLLRGCFSRFLNCANETKSRKELQILPVINLFHANFTRENVKKNQRFSDVCRWCRNKTLAWNGFFIY